MVSVHVRMLQVEARSRRRGVVRSSLRPEETAGLTRSGDLSRMLPAEAHLLAAGWPGAGPDGANAARRMPTAEPSEPSAPRMHATPHACASTARACAAQWHKNTGTARRSQWQEAPAAALCGMHVRHACKEALSWRVVLSF